MTSHLKLPSTKTSQDGQNVSWLRTVCWNLFVENDKTTSWRSSWSKNETNVFVQWYYSVV